jgi:hypothetical protein
MERDVMANGGLPTGGTPPSHGTLSPSAPGTGTANPPQPPPTAGGSSTWPDLLRVLVEKLWKFSPSIVVAVLILAAVGAWLYYADREQRDKLKDYTDQIIRAQNTLNESLSRNAEFERQRSDRVREQEERLRRLQSDVENESAKKNRVLQELSNAQSEAEQTTKRAQEILSNAQKSAGTLADLQSSNVKKDAEYASLKSQYDALASQDQALQKKVSSLSSAFLRGTMSDEGARTIAFEFIAVSPAMAKGLLSNYARTHEDKPDDKGLRPLDGLIGLEADQATMLAKEDLGYSLWLVSREDKSVPRTYWGITKVNKDSCQWAVELTISPTSKKVERVETAEKWLFVAVPSEDDLNARVVYLAKLTTSFLYGTVNVEGKQEEILPSTAIRNFQTSQVDTLFGTESLVKVLTPDEFYGKYGKEHESEFSMTDYGLFQGVRLFLRSQKFTIDDLKDANFKVVPDGPREALQELLAAAARRDQKAAVPFLASGFPDDQLGKIGAAALSPVFQVASAIDNASQCAVVIAYGKERTDLKRKQLTFRKEAADAKWKLAAVQTLQP